MAAELPSELAGDWRRIEPYADLVDRLLPGELRPLVPAWALLLAELEQAALDLSEPHLAQIKLGWWQEELGLARQGRARHPVSRALFAGSAAQGVAASAWDALADGALRLAGDDRAQPSIESLLQRYCVFTAAAAAVEQQLLGAGETAHTSRVHAVHLALDQALMARRRMRQPWPLDLVARCGASPAQDGVEADRLQRFWQGYAEGLLSALTPSAQQGLYRGIAGVARSRLLRQLPHAGAGLAVELKPGLRTTFALWRSIRTGLAQRRPA